MRMIDADALIAAIKQYANDPVKLRDRRWDARCTAIIADMIGTVNTSPTVNGWISVKDRLPEGRTNPRTLDFEPVLCATAFGDVRVYKYGQRLGLTEAHFYDGYSHVDQYVTHWMFLPEPPKEEN